MRGGIKRCCPVAVCGLSTEGPHYGDIGPGCSNSDRVTERCGYRISICHASDYEMDRYKYRLVKSAGTYNLKDLKSVVFVQFSIFTSMERNLTIMKVREAILECSGWVVDQTLFSNIAVTVSFEMPHATRQKFQDRLLEHGIKVHVEKETSSSQAGDFRGTISLTFSHVEPDLKRDVPPFG